MARKSSLIRPLKKALKDLASLLRIVDVGVPDE
jgi:hypothetical protein